MRKSQVLFFSNGNTAHFRDGKQAENLQASWIGLYLKYLEENGANEADIKDIVFWLPDGRTATAFKTSRGWGWEIGK